MGVELSRAHQYGGGGPPDFLARILWRVRRFEKLIRTSEALAKVSTYLPIPYNALIFPHVDFSVEIGGSTMTTPVIPSKQWGMQK